MPKHSYLIVATEESASARDLKISDIELTDVTRKIETLEAQIIGLNAIVIQLSKELKETQKDLDSQALASQL